jgi:hypothetical protein
MSADAKTPSKARKNIPERVRVVSGYSRVGAKTVFSTATVKV